MFSRLRIEEGWFTLLLVWSLVVIAAASILHAELIDGLEVLPFIATLAVLSGLLLAKSRFSARSAHLFALVYGIFVLTYLLGKDLPSAWTWQERIADLVGRQASWLSKVFSENSSRDGLIFVMHTSAVFWLLGYTAAWYTFRRPSVWRVVLPSGLVLLSVIYYYYGPKPLVGYLALYTLIALIYVARTHLVAQERIWRVASVKYEKGIRFSFLQASFLAAIVALGVSWALPTAQASTAVGDALGETGIQDTWRGFQDNWTRLFSSLRSYGTGTNDTYGDTLTLGGPRSVGNMLVMDIYVSERIPYVYWQGVAFDTYVGGSWKVTDTEQALHFPDDGVIDSPVYKLREQVVQTVINYIPNAGTIYAAPEIAAADRQMYVTHGRDNSGKPVVQQTQSRFVMRPGEEYQVVSRYSVADATSLRGAPQEYPEWIRTKYLPLPDTVTPETIALATEITQGYDNPFDKAIAVRDYLRSNIAYNDQISAAPEGVDPVHYILFEHQEAYCNYYASAMAVMLRSQGVPARFVAGYAQGEWDDATSSYRVRSSNAHSWTEVYFPGYGWIQFEPTASLPAGDRPESSGNPGDAFGLEAANQDENNGLGDEGPFDPTSDVERLSDLLGEDQLGGSAVESTAARWWQAAIAATILGLGIVVTLVASRVNRQVESNIDRSYGRLERWAPWLGVLIRPAHTPYERADLLAAAVPEGKEPLRTLTYQYVRQRFSPHRTADSDFDPRSQWRVLRPAMLRQTISHQLRRLRPRKNDS